MASDLDPITERAIDLQVELANLLGVAIQTDEMRAAVDAMAGATQLEVAVPYQRQQHGPAVVLRIRLGLDDLERLNARLRNEQIGRLRNLLVVEREVAKEIPAPDDTMRSYIEGRVASYDFAIERIDERWPNLPNTFDQLRT